MASTTINKLYLIQAHSATPAGMHFYASIDSVLQDESVTAYSSVIKRAWQEMKLQGVLFLDGYPVLYLKEYARPFTNRERRDCQRLFWNQGVANILVLADPTTVYLYSGLVEPAKKYQNHSAADNALLDKLTLAEYVARIQPLYHALATGHFYETHQSKFDPGRAVDMSLLDNLRTLRDALTQGPEKLGTQKAHALIGRILFVCYLLDRGIYSLSNSGDNRTGTACLTELLENMTDGKRIEYLYSLFTELKDRFNGNMFDQDLESEKRCIRPSHLQKLLLFLGGHDVKRGQLSIWPYDFKMIPVETISAIYQDFLGTEDPKKQRKRGAFYTPRFLAEMVVDMALRDKPDALDGSFLDPACGSGVFLVILFNRIANRWLLRNKRATYTAKDSAFKKILSHQIRGVDLEETACRIACFSLYLAYLDFFDPPDIREYIQRTGQTLPKLLDYGNAADRPSADIPVIQKANFLDAELFVNRKVDCVIGNPPWEGRGSKQLAQKFMQHTPGKLKPGGIGCLLLPTKILQNQTDAFQNEWLRQVTLEEVLQLADYRFLLFQNAVCPAFIARFINTPSQPNRHHVVFNAPKFNRDGLRQGIIKINPSSRTWIPLTEILAATRKKNAPVVWKKHLWGTGRDQKLIDLLQSMPSLNASVDILSKSSKKKKHEDKKWAVGQGLKPWSISKTKSDRQPKEMQWPEDMAFLDAKSWTSDLLMLDIDTVSLKEFFNKKKYRTDILYSRPPAVLFKAPMVLVNQGFSKIAYCESDVLFQDSLQSISGPKVDSKLLMFLTAYLRSKLSRYFLFHTSANWGSERDKVHLTELLRVPFPLPGNEFVSSEADSIVSQVANGFKKLKKHLTSRLDELVKPTERNEIFDEAHKQALNVWHRERKGLVDHLQTQFDPLIYQYFGLTDQEIALVEDTNALFITSSTPTTWRTSKSVTLDPLEKCKIAPYAENGLGVYADMLTSTLNSWAATEGANLCVRAEGCADRETGLSMVTVSISEKTAPYAWRRNSKELFDALKNYQESVSSGQGSIKYERDTILYQGEKIYIVRPNILLNWTRTAALNDAARIYADITMAERAS